MSHIRKYEKFINIVLPDTISDWKSIKKENKFSKFLLNVLRDEHCILESKNRKINRRKSSTYAPNLVEDFIGCALRGFLKNKLSKEIFVIINGKIKKSKGENTPNPDIMVSRTNENTISLKEVYALIEINTGTGWGRNKVIQNFNSKIRWLERSGVDKKRLFMIFFDIPLSALKKIFGKGRETEIINKFKSKLEIPNKNIFLLSKRRWFGGEEDLFESIESLFERILELVKMDGK